MSANPLQSQPLTLLPIAEMANRRPDVQRHQFIPRGGPAPVENHRANPPNLSYSNVARQGIGPNQGHAGHEKPMVGPNGQNAVQVMNQSQMPSQVANVNPSGAQMTGAPVANPGPNQIQMIPNNVIQTPGTRYAPHHAPFHQNHQHVSRQRTLITNNRPPNPIANSGVQSTMGHNMPQFYIQPSIQPQHITTQDQTNALYNHGMPHQYQQRPHAMQGPYVPYHQVAFPTQQTPFTQQQYAQYAGAMAYGTSPHSGYQPQPPSQMIPQQIQSRNTPVPNATVIQPPQQIVPITQNTPEVSEATPIPNKPAPQRQRTRAILTDPNTGKDVDIEALAKEEPKNQAPTSRSESFTGASSNSNALSTSTPKVAQNDGLSIGLEFATKVAVAATESIAKRTGSPNATESDNSLNSNLNKSETEDSVAISKSSTSELSETNDKISDICDNSTEDKNLVNNNTDSNSNNVSNSGIKTDSRQLNKTSAQSSVKSVSHTESVSSGCGKEINENGDISDTCNEALEEKEERQEIAKEYSIQKNNINNNNNIHKKEMIITEDNLTKSEDVVDNKVVTSNVSDITVSVVNVNSEPQPKSDRLSPVMTPSEYVDKTDENDDDNYSDKSDSVINKVDEISMPIDEEGNESESAPETPKSTLPDLPYSEDQWTPLNPEGKKRYDRDFLLAVRQKAENFLEMPKNLLNDKRSQEIIRKEPSGAGHYPNDPGSMPNFMPNYASKHQYERQRHPNLMPPVSRRQSQPGRHTDKVRKIISTSLTQDVQLRTVDNAWKPTKLGTNAIDPKEQETLELLKKIRGILNKLTPQKYDDLVKQIMSFKIDTEDKLKRVLDLIFEKAVDEPAFCLQYANLCKHMAKNLTVTINKDDNVEEVKFQKLLISKCQKEFEADVYASITDMQERQDQIDNCEDPQKKKMLKEILDEDMRRARKRSLGNIKLIGELYKLNMLKAYIMIQCIGGLINDADDESLECLCALLRTIGDQIENEAKSAETKNQKVNYTQILDNFFAKMESIAEQKNPDVKGTSARVRFMLRDIIDMRANGWRARRDENLPKTIEEIHQDVQKEDEQTARDLHQHTINKKQEERERKQKGGRQGDEGGEAWKTVTARKSQNTPNPNIDWGMMRSQQQVNHENVQLGPQTGLWSMGSRGGAQSSSQSKFTSKEDNRFSALDGNDPRKSSQKSNSSRDSSKGRSNQSHSYQSGRSGNRSQRRDRDDRDDAINLARTFSSHRQSPSDSSHIYSNMSRNSSRGPSREASAPNSRNSSMRRETPELESTNPLKGTFISEDELNRKTENSIKEYLNVRDLNEVAMDVTSLCNESNVHLFINHAINQAVDSTSQKIRFDIGRLFDHLLNKRLIKLDHFHKGLSLVLDMEEDIIIDIPKFWEYIGEVLAPILVNMTTDRKLFLSEVTKCKPDKRSLIVAKVFNAVSKYTDTAKAHELFVNSGLHWNDYLGPKANVEEFVRNHDVEFTIRSSNKPSNSDNFNQLSDVIEQMVRQKQNETNKLETLNDQIQEYISKNFNPKQTNDPRFSSALFSAVIRGCINDPSEEGQYSYHLNKPLLQHVSPLLLKFLGGDADKELQALIALQELMGSLQHPPNLLYNIFQFLYENSVISHDAFLQWQSSDNTAPSKAAAVVSVVRFLTWLRENEESEEDDQNETNS